MTTVGTRRRRSLVMASLTGVLIGAEAALAAIGGTVWNAQRHGYLTAPEAATFVVVGLSAVVGAVALLLALIALARGAQGQRVARVASGLAWLRAAAVVVALIAVAARLGVSAVAGSLQTVGAAVAGIDAVFALVVTGAAARRARHE